MACAIWEMLSALGTLAAVGVALGVSIHSVLATKKVESDRAELAAAKMLTPLSVLERKAMYINMWFGFSGDAPEAPDSNLLLAVEELDAFYKSISLDDLYPLLQLPSHAAKRAAKALGLIQAFVSDARPVLLFLIEDNVDSSQIAVHYKRFGVMLNEITEHLTVAVATCDVAASSGAPRPSAEELYGS